LSYLDYIFEIYIPTLPNLRSPSLLIENEILKQSNFFSILRGPP